MLVLQFLFHKSNEVTYLAFRASYVCDGGFIVFVHRPWNLGPVCVVSVMSTIHDALSGFEGLEARNQIALASSRVLADSVCFSFLACVRHGSILSQYSYFDGVQPVLK